MVTIDESDKYTYPYTTEENEFVDVRSFQEPLHERAMADARHEANHRKVSWRNLGASFEVIRAHGTSLDLTFHGIDHYTGKKTDIDAELPPAKSDPSQLATPIHKVQSDGFHLELQFNSGSDRNSMFRIGGPSKVAREAMRTLNMALMIGENKDLKDLAFKTTMPRTTSVLLKCLENAGCEAVGTRYRTNWPADEGGVFIQLFSERPIDEIKVRFSAHVLSEIQERVEDLKSRGADPSSLHHTLSDFSEELFRSVSGGKLDKVAQKTKELAEQVE
jgi:hypothetical protein